jgi:hypothetical protein
MSDTVKQVSDRADLEALYLTEEIDSAGRTVLEDLIKYYSDVAAILRRIAPMSDLELYRQVIMKVNGVNVSEPYANTFLKDLARSAA